MIQVRWLLLALPLLACQARPNVDDDSTEVANPEVEIVTSLGAFTVEVMAVESPVTAANFLSYVDEGFYDGGDGAGATTFHRIIAGFMAQGGGLTEAGAWKATHDAIVNEAITNGLLNLRYTVAMARTTHPDSATSQFFVNTVDNPFLDPGPNSPDGYCVFGRVGAGQDQVDTLGAVPTDSQDAPLTPVVITQVRRL